MITHRIVFTPGTQARLTAEGFDTMQLNFNQELPAGLWPAPGDLYADDRVSRHIFIVVNRLFDWRENGDLTYQLLLDIAPGSSLPKVGGAGGTVLPFTK